MKEFSKFFLLNLFVLTKSYAVPWAGDTLIILKEPVKFTPLISINLGIAAKWAKGDQYKFLL